VLCHLRIHFAHHPLPELREIRHSQKRMLQLHETKHGSSIKNFHANFIIYEHFLEENKLCSVSEGTHHITNILRKDSTACSSLYVCSPEEPE
jgi:hypothetical protein